MSLFMVGLLILLPFLPFILFEAGLMQLGQTLRSRSRDKREILRALFMRDVDLDTNVTVEEVENGWEKVATPPLKPKQDEWSGIIGFFHPFW